MLPKMRHVLKYKCYSGSVEFDPEDRIFHGRILGITDVVGFEGQSASELENSFHEAVEDYLETCREIGKKLENPCFCCRQDH